MPTANYGSLYGGQGNGPTGTAAMQTLVSNGTWYTLDQWANAGAAYFGVTPSTTNSNITFIYTGNFALSVSLTLSMSNVTVTPLNAQIVQNMYFMLFRFILFKPL